MRPPVVRACLASILLLATALNFHAIDYGQPAHYDQAVDGLHPVFALDAVRHAFSERSEAGHKYPRLHYVVTGLAEWGWLALRRGADEANAHVDRMLDLFDRAAQIPPDVLRKAYAEQAHVLGEMIVVGRCVAALYGLVLVWTMFRFARRFAGDAAGLFAAACTASSFPIVFYAHTLNVDIPYVAWGLLALDQAVAAVQTGKTAAIVRMGVFAALAGATKDQVYGWFVFTIPVILWLLARPGRLGAEGPVRAMPWRGLAIAAPVAVVTYLVAFGVPWDMRAFHAHFAHIFGAGVDPFREAPPTFAGQLMLQQLVLRHLLDAMGVVLLLAAVAGFVVLFRQLGRGAWLVLVPALSYDATFIAPIGYCYLRFTIPIQLMLLVAAAAAFAWLLEGPRRRVLGIALLAFALGRGAWLTHGLLDLMRHEPWTPATRWLRENVEPTAFVVTSLDLPMHNIDPPAAARVVERRYGDPLPENLGVPDWIVISLYDTGRRANEIEPRQQIVHDRIDAFGTRYEAAAKFLPVREHPIRKSAAFQPQIVAYRRVP